MTTTDMPETPTPEPPAPTRVLRRSRDSRVAAGVSGGLGEYFGVDAVLFRVLFATSAFFGGAGIVAYLVAWAAIPEKGTDKAPIDGMMGELRRRRIPPWAIAVGVGLLLWAVTASWWSPGPVVPILIVVVLLAVGFGRRDLQGDTAPPAVDLIKHPAAPSPSALPVVDELKAWWLETQAASRRRGRRALPVKIATLGGLAATLLVLALVDANTGIPLPVYLWVTLGFVGTGLLMGAVLRRTPWSITSLLVPVTAGLVAFSGTPAQLHDGVGDRTWTPTTRLASEYRVAFGQGVLDLRSLPEQTTPRTVRVVVAAGQVRVLTRASANVTFRADIRFGRVDFRSGNDLKTSASGVRPGYEIPAPADATGARTTVIVELAAGQVELVRR